jgi:hypothetical protein
LDTGVQLSQSGDEKTVKNRVLLLASKKQQQEKAPTHRSVKENSCT